MFGPEFFIAFGVGMLISGTATALYYSEEHIKRALRIPWFMVQANL